MTSNPYILHQLRLLNGWHGNLKMSWKNRRESARVYLVIALSYACGNLKTVLKVWSQLLENFHYHGSVRNAKLLNWTVFDRLLPPCGRQNSQPRYKLWFRRVPVLPCLRFQQTEHQHWLVLSAGKIHWGIIVIYLAVCILFVIWLCRSLRFHFHGNNDAYTTGVVADRRGRLPQRDTSKTAIVV